MVKYIIYLVLLMGNNTYSQSSNCNVCKDKMASDFISKTNSFVEVIDSLEVYKSSSEKLLCKGITQKLNAHLGKKYFKKSKSHLYIELINAGNYFSIHEYIFKNENQVSKILNKFTEINRMSFLDEGLTQFNYQCITNKIYILISSRSAFNKAKSIFDRFVTIMKS